MCGSVSQVNHSREDDKTGLSGSLSLTHRCPAIGLLIKRARRLRIEMRLAMGLHCILAQSRKGAKRWGNHIPRDEERRRFFDSTAHLLEMIGA